MDRISQKTSNDPAQPRATRQDEVRENRDQERDRSFWFILSGRRKSWLGIILLILACIVGGAASGEISPDRGQGVLVITVVLFVAAMLALALAMMDGNSTQNRR